MTTSVDPRGQVVFLLGGCNRAEVMRYLRRFSFDDCATLLGRRPSDMLSSVEIHELRQRAVGWSDNDYDIERVGAGDPTTSARPTRRADGLHLGGRAD